MYLLGKNGTHDSSRQSSTYVHETERTLGPPSKQKEARLSVSTLPLSLPQMLAN